MIAQLRAGAPTLPLAEHAAVIRALGKRVVGDVIEIGRRAAHTSEGAHWPWWLRGTGLYDTEEMRTLARQRRRHVIFSASYSMYGCRIPVEAVIVHTNLLVVAAILVERMTGVAWSPGRPLLIIMAMTRCFSA